MKRSLLACVCVAALALATVNAHAAAAAHSGTFKLPTWFKVVGIFTAVCATSIIGAAMVKNNQQNKPLSQDEAFSCGWRWWVK